MPLPSMLAVPFDGLLRIDQASWDAFVSASVAFSSFDNHDALVSSSIVFVSGPD